MKQIDIEGLEEDCNRAMDVLSLVTIGFSLGLMFSALVM